MNATCAVDRLRDSSGVYPSVSRRWSAESSTLSRRWWLSSLESTTAGSPFGLLAAEEEDMAGEEEGRGRGRLGGETR